MAFLRARQLPFTSLTQHPLPHVALLPRSWSNAGRSWSCWTCCVSTSALSSSAYGAGGSRPSHGARYGPTAHRQLLYCARGPTLLRVNRAGPWFGLLQLHRHSPQAHPSPHPCKQMNLSACSLQVYIWLDVFAINQHPGKTSANASLASCAKHALETPGSCMFFPEPQPLLVCQV